jgi:hypothetical protein
MTAFFPAICIFEGGGSDRLPSFSALNSFEPNPIGALKPTGLETSSKSS